MSKILVFGKNGQVGWELQRSLGLCGDVVFLGRNDRGGDLLDIDNMVARIQEESPDIVFNAAAYTAVDAAETDFETAKRVNGDAVGAIAQACKDIDSLLIHYSTDYVFSGVGDRPWSEDDSVAPINAYGLSKSMGEAAILRSGCKAYIFRTSWVYGVHGKNFLKTILKLIHTRDTVSVISDQIGTPTPAELVADVSAWISQHAPIPKGTEVIHLVPNGVTSWYDFARYIILNDKQSKAFLEKIQPIDSSKYMVSARRPLNSRMNNSKLLEILPEKSINDWRIYVNRVMHELAYKDDTEVEL